MLAADPDAGLEMFSAMDPPLPTAAVLAMLTSYAPQLAGAYLEAALAQASKRHAMQPVRASLVPECAPLPTPS